MKQMLFVFFLIGFASVASAQQQKPITVSINTPTVQCDMCKRKIEDFLKYEEGVTKVVVYPKQKKTTVTYLTDRTNLENIKTAIANTGYDAEEVKAEKDAYNKLPACCKKPSGK
jgi:copper chaperone CopZ